MSKVPALAAALLASALSLPSIAHEVVYTTHLTGPAESPPNASPGTGDATVVFDLDMVTMHVEVSFAGLAGPTTASRRSEPAPAPPGGSRGSASCAVRRT